MPETDEPADDHQAWPGDDADVAEPVVDRSGLTDADLEPRPPSRLGRRLRFLSGAQVAVIILVLILVVPLILAVVLTPVVSFLSR